MTPTTASYPPIDLADRPARRDEPRQSRGPAGPNDDQLVVVCRAGDRPGAQTAPDDLCS